MPQDRVPVTRANVTSASRIMLPVYVLFSGALGLVWLLQDTNRTNRSLTALAAHWPVPATGAVLVVLAVLILGSLLTRLRVAAAVAVAAAGMAYLVLGVIFMGPLGLGLTLGWPLLQIRNPAASLSAPFWPWFVAVAHFASVASLVAEESTDPAGINRRRGHQ